ncbi:MAG: isomerase DpgB [Mycobacterium sp.]|jgi:isomerase DpgB|nr:isomerase DpgB [Mycobacterium sp.]MDT5355949.1 isomerase DpgB [Mycobacterium sp.]
MIEPSRERTNSFTLPVGEIAGRTQALSEFMRSQDRGVAVIDLREADSKHLSPGDGIGEVNGWERALHVIERSSAATVAVFGHQVGGCALEVGLACDFRIADPASQVIWHNDGAVWPSTALFRLVQLIGPALTIRLTALGEPMHARAALVSGLVDVITDNPEAEVATIATAVGRLDNLRIVRQLIAEAAHSNYDEALGAHLAASERYLRRRGAD